MSKTNEMEAKIRDVLLRRRTMFSSLSHTSPYIFLDIGTDTLDKTNAVVTHVCIITPQNDFIIITHPEEAEVLQKTLTILNTYRDGTIVGFNHMEFDLPILRTRLQHYGLPTFYFRHFIDIRQVLCNGNKYMPGTLSEFAQALGLREECSGWSKRDHVLLWQDPTIESLRNFLLYDVKATQLLFSVLNGEYNEKIDSMQEVQQLTLCESW